MRISDTGTVRTVRYATEDGGVHVGDDHFDVIIPNGYGDVYVPCNEDGVQVGNVEIVPRWTLEHPEWEDQDGIDLFWEVVQECEIERGRDANGDGEIAIVRWKKY